MIVLALISRLKNKTILHLLLGVLCKDDNLSTSLAPAPIDVPVSPYSPTVLNAQCILKGNLFEEQRACNKPTFVASFRV